MSGSNLLSALLIASLALSATGQEVSADGPGISPFRGMRIAPGGIEVQVDDDRWYALESIEKFGTEELLADSQRMCGDQWWKRLTEDLPAVLAAMGHAPGRTVDLQLRDSKTGEVTRLTGVRMTRANRQRLAAADAHADLAQLGAALDESYSYRYLRDIELREMIWRATRRLGSGEIAQRDLAAEVDRILRAFGDGHSRLAGGQLRRPTAHAPFLVQKVRGGYAAFHPDRSGLIDAARPFVDAIDGMPLERWLEASRQTACQGSPAMVQRDTERGLRHIEALRRELELPAAATVTITLRGATGAEPTELPMARDWPIYGQWPRTSTGQLEGDVGYLRIPKMSRDRNALDEIDAAMQRFRDSRALIIDVRGNGGGSRDILRRLLPYLLADDDPPQVVNAAMVLRQRDDDKRRGGLLADRGMHPADWPGWNDAQRRAVAEFQESFAPVWTPTRREFSQMHYFVIDRDDNPAAFAYPNKVFVLLDAGCFSATDILLGALATRPQVTLVGTPSSGGSGRARGYRLTNSRIKLQLSSMVSYRPDGRLFEGNGVAPDMKCEPVPRDLVLGGSDTVLDKALELAR